MKTQALRGAQEIMGYYSKKYKKVVKKYGAVNKGKPLRPLIHIF